MGVKTTNDNNGDKYTFYRKAGRSIIEQRPVFSPDGESLALIVEDVVRVYNIQTGVYVRTLETESNVNKLVAIEFPENEGYNLYGCSDCGRVTIWTWRNGAVLREIKLQLPENMRIQTFNLLDVDDCFILACPRTGTPCFATYSTKSGQLLHDYKQKLYVNDMIRIAIGWCKGDRFAAIINGTNILYILNLHRPHVRSTIINPNCFRILSVAAHREDGTVVITDTLGRATILRGNLYDSKTLAKEVLHWHQLPLIASTFSVQGSYLYTGGLEKTLVKWTASNLATKSNERSYIPRLPGFIRYITASDTHVAITLSNNSVVIANTQMHVVATILECGGLSPAARAIGTSLVYHRRLGALLMGGRTGHLQLYSTATDKLLYNVDITQVNNLPSERENLLPIETEVTCVAVSANGQWLATSEYRNDGFTYPEERLKFWFAQTKGTSPFTLNTCVNLSHGGCNVVSIAFNDKGEICISAGTDQKFRIWKRESPLVSQEPQSKNKMKPKTEKKWSWSCLTACYYSSGASHFLSHGVLNNFKVGESFVPGQKVEMPYMTKFMGKYDLIRRIVNIHKQDNLVHESEIYSGMNNDNRYGMGDVAISQDGSLIAAWFGCKLTLWDTKLCNLRTVLAHPALRPKGIHVQFGNKDAAHYLVCTTEFCLAVWSLLSLTIKWLVQIRPTYLAADPFSNKMAVITIQNDVYVFTPHSSTPVLTKKRLLNGKKGSFKQCTFGAARGDDVRLYLIRNDCEIYCIEPEGKQEVHLEVLSSDNRPKSKFGALVAEQQTSEVQTAAAADLHHLDTNKLTNNVIAQFLSAAPHMVPPVSLLCTSFLEHISGHQNMEEASEEQEQEAMDVDQESSDDEEESVTLNGEYAPKTTQLWTPSYTEIKEKRLKKIIKAPLLNARVIGDIFGV